MRKVAARKVPQALAALSDLRIVPRELRRSPWVILLTLATLGLGLGAATAVYSVIRTVLIAPLPYPEADRLVRIHSVRGGSEGHMSMLDLQSIEETNLFVDIAVHTDDGGGYTMADGEGVPHQASAILASANLFEVLGVPPVRGTTWPELYDRERAYGIVLGDDLFQSRFAGDPEMLGTTIRLDGSPGYEIHGVMGPDLDYPYRTDLYRSLFITDTNPGYTDRSSRRVRGLARLRAGVAVEQAQAAVDRVADQLAANEPATNRGVSFRLIPLRDWYVGDTVAHLVLASLGSVLLLALAVANASNLLFARGFARENELAMRLVLGAPRSRIVTMLVLEGVGIAAAAAALGWIVARAGVSALVSMVRLDLPSWMVVEVDGGALGVALLAACLVGAMAAAVPALRLSRPSALHAARSSARGGLGRSRALSGALVSAEVGLAVAVLTIGVSVARGLDGVLRVDLGYDSENVLAFKVNLPWYLYGDDADVHTFHREVIAGLEALPGAVAATSSTNLPLAVPSPTDHVRLLSGSIDVEVAETGAPTAWSLVDPRHFEAMRIPVAQGRAFRATDAPSSEFVAIVTEDEAARLWPGQDPLGRTVRAVAGARWPFLDREFRVVGVVPAVRHDPRGSAVPHIYLSSTQFVAENTHFAVRFAAGEAATRARAVERVVQTVDPLQPVWDVGTLEARRSDQVWRERIVGSLLTVFSVLGLGLSATGVFGLVAFSVAQRRREIGLASALGAGRRRIVVSEMLRAWRVIWPGLVGGLLGGMAMTVAGSSLIPTMAPWDIVVAGGAIGLLGIVAALSALGPSLRAARIEPTVALNEQG